MGFMPIHDFNLDVDDGRSLSMVFVRDHSGCGKSTVLRMLAGLEEITSGKLLLDGKVINNRPPVEPGYCHSIVFQDYALYGNLSVYDNVGMSIEGAAPEGHGHL